MEAKVAGPDGSSRVDRHIKAPRAVVYEALLDPTAVAAWRVPDGMTGHVHELDARPLQARPGPQSVTAAGSCCARLADIDFTKAQREVDEHLWLALRVAREAALAVHLMTNTALTGATYDVDGGQQVV